MSDSAHIPFKKRARFSQTEELKTAVFREESENSDGASDWSKGAAVNANTAHEANREEDSRSNEILPSYEDSDGDEYGTLARALRAQREYAKDKNISRDTPPRKKYRSRDELVDYISEQDGPGFEQRWMDELRKYPESFFASEEGRMIKPAGMANTFTGRQRKKSYKGVSVDKDNNKDIAFVCRNLYMENNATCDNFMICAGQFARLAIANKCAEKEDLWECGQFFRVCSRKGLFQLFIGHYENESTSATVMNKATHLRNFVDHAIYYFSIVKPTSPSEEAKQSRSRMIAKMGVVYKYLGRTAARAKRDARLEKAARNGTRGNRE